MARVAFVTGGNGITGSAIAEYLVSQTTKQQWRKIIVTSRGSALLPIHDPRVVFIALDFTKSADDLVQGMKNECSDITHAFFSSYVHRNTFSDLASANCSLFENFLMALVKVAPSLQNVTLQTGGKHYDLHLKPVPTPVREEDCVPETEGVNFYHSQQLSLASKQRQSSWSYNVIRPQAIIGVAYGPNGMNSALCFAVYFTICSHLNIEAKMLTNEHNYGGAEDVSSSRLIADLSVFTATNPRCANEAFNATNTDHFLWRYMWPRLAAYFGAHASSDQIFTEEASYSAKVGSTVQEETFVDWSKDKRKVWDDICDSRGVHGAKATFDSATWAYQDWVFQRTWTSTLSMNKARKFGWNGWADSYECFVETFARFERMCIIPPRKVQRSLPN